MASAPSPTVNACCFGADWRRAQTNTGIPNVMKITAISKYFNPAA